MGSEVSQSNPLESREPEQSVQGERPELSDATRYDLDRLERAIGDLVGKYSQLVDQHAMLRSSVEERDRTIHELEAQLEQTVVDLTAAQVQLDDERTASHSGLRERDLRIRELEGELEAAAQRRRAAIERVDRLVVELDRLDAKFEEQLTA